MLAALPNAGPSLVEVVLPRLINELALLEAPVVLVLDDYHLLHERAAARLGRLPPAPPAADGADRDRQPRRPSAAARTAPGGRRARRGPGAGAAVRRRRGRTAAQRHARARPRSGRRAATAGAHGGLARRAPARRALPARPQRPRRVHPLAGRRRPPDRRLPARGGRGRAASAAGVPAAHVDPRAHVRAAVRRGHRSGGQRDLARRGVPVEPVRRRARRPRLLVSLPPPAARPPAARARARRAGPRFGAARPRGGLAHGRRERRRGDRPRGRRRPGPGRHRADRRTLAGGVGPQPRHRRALAAGAAAGRDRGRRAAGPDPRLGGAVHRPPRRGGARHRRGRARSAAGAARRRPRHVRDEVARSCAPHTSTCAAMSPARTPSPSRPGTAPRRCRTAFRAC